MLKKLLPGLFVIGFIMGCGPSGPWKVGVLLNKKSPAAQNFINGIQYFERLHSQDKNIKLKIKIFDESTPAESLSNLNAIVVGPIKEKSRILEKLGNINVPSILATVPDIKIPENLKIWRVCLSDKYKGYASAYYIFRIRKIKNAGIITWNGHEFSGIGNFLKIHWNKLSPRPLEIMEISGEKPNYREIKKFVRRVGKRGAIFVLASCEHTKTILKLLRKAGFKGPVFEYFEWTKCKYPEWEAGEILTITDYFPLDSAALNFQKKFKELYKYEPGPVEALAKDAMETVYKTFSMMESRDAEEFVAKISLLDFEGVTGNISFGSARNPKTKKPIVLEITPKGPRVVAKLAISPYSAS